MGTFPPPLHEYKQKQDKKNPIEPGMIPSTAEGGDGVFSSRSQSDGIRLNEGSS